MQKPRIYFLISFILFNTVLFSQEKEEELIDASKPTNFYTLLDNTLEFTNHSTNGNKQNVFGYRGKLVLALSESNLILAELPLLVSIRSCTYCNNFKNGFNL